MNNTVLGFAVQQKFPTAISQTYPVTVTVDNHGMVSGNYVRATNFFPSPSAVPTGMEQLNNNLYIIGNVTTNTFDLFYSLGVGVDGTNFTAFINNGLAMFTLTGEDLFTQNLNTMNG